MNNTEENFEKNTFTEAELLKLREEQAKHRRQLAENREKTKQRKLRTRRLITHGAIAEAMIPGAEDMDDEAFTRALEEALADS